MNVHAQSGGDIAEISYFLGAVSVSFAELYTACNPFAPPFPCCLLELSFKKHFRKKISFEGLS